MVSATAAGDTYSAPVGGIYIFNLIVGVGALALPSGFYQAGLILGLIFLFIMAFLAYQYNQYLNIFNSVHRYLTVTWLNEVQASGNAYLRLKQGEKNVSVVGNIQDAEVDDTEADWLVPKSNEQLRGGEGEGQEKVSQNPFEIKERVELGLLSELFLGPIGQKAFYAIIVIYLYGDLAIYAVAVPTSLTAVTGGWTIGSLHVSEWNTYYVYLTIFVLFIVPWTFFNFQKTKILQLATVFTRNLALFTMIILALIFIGEGEGANAKKLPWFDFSGLPNLFGVTIYSFMCHHSLPSLITPLKNKRVVNKLIAVDFTMIYLTYALLCGSALFAFGDLTNTTCEGHPSAACTIQQLITLNYASYDIRPIAIFLTLFPVFTLSSNFPLIAITLRNNLMILIPYGQSHPQLRQIAFALLATVPPIALAYAVRDVSLLVGITGSYAGLGIMFIIPAALLVYSRRTIKQIPAYNNIENPYTSPFGHKAWIIAIIVACAGNILSRDYLKVVQHVWD